MDDFKQFAASREDSPTDLTPLLDANLEQFRTLMGTSPDLIFREFVIAVETERRAAIIYLDHLVVKDRIAADILRPLTANAAELAARNVKPEQIARLIQSRLLTTGAVTPEKTFPKAAANLCAGDTLLLVDGLAEAFIFNTRGGAHRAVGLPETEETVRGPRDSFVETLDINLALLRHRISHPDLQVEAYRIGLKTATRVNLVYLQGVVNEKVVRELRLRLGRIKTDGILGAGYIEQFIGDAPLSPFSTIAYSERPDVIAAKILEGRVAVFIDGSPEVLTAPALFVESFQNPDDYNFHPYYATLIRWIRYIAFGFSILGPASYVALASFNQELIPTPLFINIAAGTEGTPYPTSLEVIIIGLLFEIFREAGIRLPRPYGPGITFVLALVMAQTAVAIGLAGVGTVAIVALTAIASLIVPNQVNASILLRLGLVVAASIFGAYGILLGLLILLAHLVSLRSCGVPYLAPLAPFNPRDFSRDTLIRSYIWAMAVRPRTIGWHNPRRGEEDSMPAAPEQKEKNHSKWRRS